MTKLISLNHKKRETIFPVECSQADYIHVNICIWDTPWEKCVFVAYIRTAKSQIWLQHSLSAYSTLDIVGYIHIWYNINYYQIVRLHSWSGSLLFICIPKTHFLMVQLAPYFHHKYLDRQTCTNSIDPDQTPPSAASDLGLHCLRLIWLI